MKEISLYFPRSFFKLVQKTTVEALGIFHDKFPGSGIDFITSDPILEEY